MEEISRQTILQPLTLDQESQGDDRQHRNLDWQCIFCDYTERNENDSKKILQHIYFVHRMIIADANDISDLREYLRFWKKEFEGKKTVSTKEFL